MNMVGRATVRLEREQTTEKQVAFLIESSVEAAGSVVTGAEIGLAVSTPGSDGFQAWVDELLRDVRSILSGGPGRRSREGLSLRLRTLGLESDPDELARIEWQINFIPELSVLSEIVPGRREGVDASSEIRFRQVERPD
jgi:hypothetical protein